MKDDRNSCELGKAAKKPRIEAEDTADRLSSLPYLILHHILEFLDTKSVVQTSVLSRAWRSTWKEVSVLNFQSDSFDRYSSFQTYVDKVLSLRHPGVLSVVEYSDNENREERDGDLFVKVIEHAITHDTKHLVMDLSNGKEFQPSSAFSFLFHTVSDCKLESLALRCVILDSEFTSAGFRMLTTLTLFNSCMTTPGMGDVDPFSGFPCLKHLTLIASIGLDYFEDVTASFKISGSQLITLEMAIVTSSKIEICAPKLRDFGLQHDLGSLNFSSLILPSLKHAEIGISDKTNRMEADKESMARRLMFLFQGLSAAKGILLHSKTIQILGTIDSAILEQQRSPFTRLKTLIVEGDAVPYQLIDYFLEGSTTVVEPTLYRVKSIGETILE
ncbi:unnamed protein product [Linum tenue]|uniref:F-box domain-containing protein n=1 Tax=Linum tenue TaxID=586396 RepID=A0AAV0JVW4_9ROSI|nr:unnamed protein product [Linum tenue]